MWEKSRERLERLGKFRRNSLFPQKVWRFPRSEDRRGLGSFLQGATNCPLYATTPRVRFFL